MAHGVYIYASVWVTLYLTHAYVASCL